MLKFFGIVGLVGAVAITYFATYGVGPEAQLPPEVSLLEGFREEGFLPEDRNLAIDERAEEAGVFSVPEGDAAVLAAAIAAQGDMAGMDMSGSTDMAATDGAATMPEGMDMSGADGTDMAGMDMSGSTDMAATDGAAMPEGMDMSGAGGTDMAGMDMSGSTDMAATDGAAMPEGMDMSGAGGMAMGDIPMGEAGLGFAEEASFDREIALTMSEWEFSEMSIDVKMGERIKFTVKNGGQIPHEFMFMSAPLMAAASYRGTRADWNLLEHEALFEQSLVLPGGEFSFVLEVQANGSWMFMCMLPYHMQMGMMGQMATEGAAMDMAM